MVANILAYTYGLLIIVARLKSRNKNEILIYSQKSNGMDRIKLEILRGLNLRLQSINLIAN